MIATAGSRGLGKIGRAMSVGAVALMLLSPLACAAAEPALECDFDQAYLAKRLQQAASRNGGARLDAADKTATWRLRNGETVQVTHGGCVDLGTTVRLIYAKGRPAPSREAAVERIIGIAERYWSAADARRIEAAYRRGKPRERQIDPGKIELSGALDPVGFSFEFYILLSGSEVELSWQEA
ncbi:hypothetical protein [Pseudomonas sp. CGJS7]|uniref:hypothetical protein n=1 Tax=Pseudomonas sp. CGJS7 TaxID=3109348 RepID=UPI003009952F